MGPGTAGESRDVGRSTGSRPRVWLTSSESGESGESSTSIYPISSAARGRFAPALRRLSDELTVGEPLKSRLILEMAADLESMAEHFRRRGMTEAQAVAAAEERMLATSRSLEDLIQLHTTGLERAAIRIAWGVRTGLDLTFFLIGLSPLIIAAGIAVSSQLRTDLGFGLWIVAGLGVLLVVLAGRAEWLLRGRSAELPKVRRNVAEILYLAVLAFAVGAADFVLGLMTTTWWLSQRLTAGATLAAHLWAQDLTSEATVFALALLIVVGCGLSWFVLVHRVAAREQAESASLLAA